MAEKKKNAFPEIKKKISSYLTLEDGKITKESIMTIGAFVTSAAASAALLAKTASAGHTNKPLHGNTVEVRYNQESEAAIGKHSHHGSHTNQHSSY
jgi:hypothetical protein